jgi:hypothetical protein
MANPRKQSTFLSKIKYILTEKEVHITAYGTLILAVFTGILAYGTWILAKQTSVLADDGKEQRRDLNYRANGEFVYQFYINETAHLHGIEDLYTILRQKYDNPGNYSDSIVYDKQIRCNKGTFIWRRTKDPKLWHE